MIPLKTIPAYSLVFTAVSEAAVDIRPLLCFTALFVSRAASPIHMQRTNMRRFPGGDTSRRAPCNFLGLLLLLSTSKSSAVTVIRLNERHT